MRENKVLRAFLLLRDPIKRGILLFVATVMFAAWFSPFMIPKKAEAATGQLTSRAVTISSGIPNKTSVTYTFTFTTVTSAFHLDAIKLIACTTAVGSYPGGSCTIPTAFSFASATYGSISGFTDTTVFTIDTAGSNDCVATAHPEVLCLKRTSASNDTAGAKTLVINAVHNPSTANTAFYLGITTYNANTWPSAGRQDAGTVATAVVQTLTVNAQVAEVLNFCVGNTTIDNATVSVANDCTGISGTSVNLGTLDSGTVTITPVAPGSGGDNNNAVAMVRTNAANGVTVAYDAIQQSGTNHVGTLRLSGVTCSSTPNNTDGCINAAGTSQAVFTAGTEMFGMTVKGVNCGSTSASSYSCTYASGTNNLQQTAQYVGGTNATTYGASAGKGFAWDESGTAQTIATSASSTIKQVDDEALMIAFGATPAITTPFGAYTAQADFIAVPTF